MIRQDEKRDGPRPYRPRAPLPPLSSTRTLSKSALDVSEDLAVIKALEAEEENDIDYDIDKLLS